MTNLGPMPLAIPLPPSAPPTASPPPANDISKPVTINAISASTATAAAHAANAMGAPPTSNALPPIQALAPLPLGLASAATAVVSPTAVTSAALSPGPLGLTPDGGVGGAGVCGARGALRQMARGHAPPCSRKRPRSLRRPAAIVVPRRPATSLPTSFYPEAADITACSAAANTALAAGGGGADGHKKEKEEEEVGVKWAGYDARSGAASRRGRRRRINEDEVFCKPEAGLYGVCDGHGADSFGAGLGGGPQQLPGRVVADALPGLLAGGVGFDDAFARVDAVVCGMCAPRSYVGTTVTVARVQRGVKVEIAHVGDSRAMVIGRGGQAEVLTRDHSPLRADESARIARAGGHVLRGRVNGVLAVSRAVGDRALKGVVPAVPEVCVRELHGRDEMLVVASDGLWDMVSEGEVCDMLKARRVVDGTRSVPVDMCAAAEALVDEAVSRGSRDDTSVVLVDLREI